jgi:hypothetical protein
VQGLAAVKRQAAAGGTCPAAWTPPPRGIEGALPGRVSCQRNVGTPMGSGRVSAAGRPTARDAELPGGNRMVQEANAGVPKGAGKPGQHGRVLLAAALDNRPDTGQRARTRKGADVDRVSL